MAPDTTAEKTLDKGLLKGLKHPETVFASLAATAIAGIIALSADVALVLDSDGQIQDVSVSHPGLFEQGLDTWIDKSWYDVVTVESRKKLEEMMVQMPDESVARWRQVNHRSQSGKDLPIKYTTVALGDTGKVLAIGREMMAVSELQQRVVETQLAMEREYARHRSAETRYRLFFQTSREAVIIVDAATNKIIDANPVAVQMLGGNGGRLVGNTFPRGFDTQGQAALIRLLASAREMGKSEDVKVQREGHDAELVASAALFRQDDGALYLVSLAPTTDHLESAMPERSANLLNAIESATDGVVVTDFDGRIVAANESFLVLTQIANEERARGESLDRWLGRSTVDLNILLTNLKEHKVVRQFGSIMQTEFGASTEVEISATVIADDKHPCLGFIVRPLESRSASLAPPTEGMFRPAEQLAELVGRVPLKELVQESTDIIERLCIETALELSGDNRAAAAEMLGLSRQSLYIKMRRHDLGNLEQHNA